MAALGLIWIVFLAVWLFFRLRRGYHKFNYELAMQEQREMEKKARDSRIFLDEFDRRYRVTEPKGQDRMLP